MYTLLPADADVELVNAIVVYVMAMLLGFVSHAPGTLGVFDASMLVGLGGIEKEQLLASLLAFRALYFLLPFTLALMILGVREVRSAVRGRPRFEAAADAAARSCGGRVHAISGLIQEQSNRSSTLPKNNNAR
jgi:hypothetical protein